MGSKKVLIWSTLDVEVKQLVAQLISSKGVCLSEYVRELVLEDLDKRSLITTKVKQQLLLTGGGENHE